MFVRDVMTRHPVSIKPDATLRELITLMSDKTFRSEERRVGKECRSRGWAVH